MKGALPQQQKLKELQENIYSLAQRETERELPSDTPYVSGGLAKKDTRLDNMARILCGPNTCAAVFRHKVNTDTDKILYTNKILVASNSPTMDLYIANSMRFLKDRNLDGLLKLVADEGMGIYLTRKFDTMSKRAPDISKLYNLFHGNKYEADFYKYWEDDTIY